MPPRNNWPICVRSFDLILIGIGRRAIPQYAIKHLTMQMFYRTSSDGRRPRSLTGWLDAFPQSHTRAYAPMRAATVRSCERIGWQAKAPAPQKRKPLSTKVGQTLSSVNPEPERDQGVARRRGRPPPIVLVEHGGRRFTRLWGSKCQDRRIVEAVLFREGHRSRRRRSGSACPPGISRALRSG